MASPQKENGYTPIANELLEHLSVCNVSGGAMRVAMVIIRKTYGFHKKKDRIALSQFVKATGYGKRNVIYLLQDLEAKGIIKVERKEKSGAKHPSMYAFNKNYDDWVVQNTSDQLARLRRRAKLRQRRVRKAVDIVWKTSGKRRWGGAKHRQKVVQNSVKGGAKQVHIQKKLIQKKTTKERGTGLKPMNSEYRNAWVRTVGEIIGRKME